MLFSLSFYADGKEQFYFSNLSLKEGLSQITVSCIHQDQKGFMWFGTRIGLNRYDGYNFDVFITNPGDENSLSDNHILCLEEDKEGYLWIGTNNGLNRYDPTSNKFKRYFHNSKDDTSLPHNSILSMYYDEQGNLWVGTSEGLAVYDKESDSFKKIQVGNLISNERIHIILKKNDYLYIGTLNKGLIIYNLKTKKYKVYANGDNYELNLKSNYIKALFIDSQENLWIGTHGAGAFVLNKKHELLFNVDKNNGLTNDHIRSIVEDSDGNILLGTFNGLNLYDPKTKIITQYKEYGASEGLLSHYSITTIYIDNSKSVWVGTYAGGVCYHSKSGQKFQFYKPSLAQNPIVGILGQIVETDNSFFIAAEGGGLIEMNKSTNSFVQYNIMGENPGSVSYGRNIIKSLYLDNEKIFCGTNVGTLYSFDIQQKKFSLVYNKHSEHSIYHISRSMDGKLVIGSVNQNGLTFLLNDGSIINKFEANNQTGVTFTDVRSLLEIEPNVFLIGTRNDGLYYFDYAKKVLKNYNRSSDESFEIPENYVSCILKNSSGEIWIGTVGGGMSLFDPNNGNFTTYGIKQGLLNDYICTILEDVNKQLWISTISGISSLNPKTGVIKNYTHQNGIKVDEFTPNAGIITKNREIIFSGNNGFLKFNPKEMIVNSFIPPIVLKNLSINNSKIEIGGKDGILKKQLSDTEKIILKYNQSNLSIEYSALNYIFSNMNQYRYILEGFDNDWNEVGNRRVAYYTNIPPGEYTFIVKGSNNDGVWNDTGTKFQIKILPPLWKTWWAYLLYLSAVAFIVWFVTKYFSDKKRLENDIKMKQLEAKSIAEFHEARDKLFTNFSHELRTPLTLILNPLDDMMKNADRTDLKAQKTLTLMRSNAHRLLRLVNNLMDFQKKESGKLKLKVIHGDMVKFTCEMLSFFDELANSRNIQLKYHHISDSIFCWFDKDLIEKVYFNFLSNAFKNVNNDGTVEVSVNKYSFQEVKSFVPAKYNRFENNNIPYLLIEIKNSGSEIAEEELEKIFIPFYQIAQNENSSSGTGLGLSLSKSIIEMHHGIIWAESPNNEGAVFKCVLPIDKNLFTKEEIVEGIYDGGITPFEVEVKEEETSDNLNAANKKYTILVVEDNKDVRQYIMSSLSNRYHVIEAPNGKEALQKSYQYLPDLVLTDLMMPQMDGIELCTILKNDLRTSHIPVIMITAKSMPENFKEGYSVGADAYLVKPFSIEVLNARIVNVLKNREKLKEIYSKRFSLQSLGIDATSQDELFMQKLYTVLERNISNTEMNLDDFCKDIGMSRSNMYRKLKSITNFAPNEFIRNYRLETAAKILKNSELSVSDVYVAVGFNSHAYFTNCFKNLYGVSPSEYASKNVKEGG